MKNITRKTFGGIISAILAAAVMLSAFTLTAFAANETVNTVTIFTTNDIHGVLGGDEAPISMSTIAAIKASTQNALLVDAGDATQGTSFATITKGADVIKMMNAAGYDLLVPGNHEFDYGTETLIKNAGSAEFPFVTSNVTLNEKPMFDGTVVLKAGSYKVAFIGVTTTHTAVGTNPSQLSGVEFHDEVTSVNESIDALENEAVDAIIIVGHLGDIEVDVDCTSAQLLDGLSDKALSKVTAFVDGHSHDIENGVIFSKNGKNIPIVQTGTRLNNLGRITITFDENRAAEVKAEVLSAEEVNAYVLTADGEKKAADVAKVLEEINKVHDGILGEKLCENKTPLWGGYVYFDYAETRIVETNYGDFVTDAFAHYGRIFSKQQKLDMPVVAVQNGGGISATLPFGDVTRGDVLDAYNHGNLIVAVKVNPAQLFALIENGLVTTGQDDTGMLLREKPSGSFLQVSGLTYTYDPSGESGKKIVSIVLDNGTELSRGDSESGLILVTNEYVANFAQIAQAPKLGELGGEDYIVESYILEQTENGTKPLSVPLDGGRIKILNDSSPATYTVTIPVKNSKNENAPANRVVHLSIDGAEAQQYITDKDGNISVTLVKGAHSLYLTESADNKPVYVNNYSGAGTVFTKDGVYSLSFKASDNLPEYTEPDEEPIPETGVEFPAVIVCAAFGIAAVFAVNKKKS